MTFRPREQCKYNNNIMRIWNFRIDFTLARIYSYTLSDTYALIFINNVQSSNQWENILWTQKRLIANITISNLYHYNKRSAQLYVCQILEYLNIKRNRLINQLLMIIYACWSSYGQKREQNRVQNIQRDCICLLRMTDTHPSQMKASGPLMQCCKRKTGDLMRVPFM